MTVVQVRNIYDEINTWQGPSAYKSPPPEKLRINGQSAITPSTVKPLRWEIVLHLCSQSVLCKAVIHDWERSWGRKRGRGRESGKIMEKWERRIIRKTKQNKKKSVDLVEAAVPSSVIMFKFKMFYQQIMCVWGFMAVGLHEILHCSVPKLPPDISSTTVRSSPVRGDQGGDVRPHRWRESICS